MTLFLWVMPKKIFLTCEFCKFSDFDLTKGFVFVDNIIYS